MAVPKKKATKPAKVESVKSTSDIENELKKIRLLMTARRVKIGDVRSDAQMLILADKRAALVKKLKAK